MAEFLFIHGAWHGAWCWDDLIPALAAQGHTSHVLDLPGQGEDRTPLSEVTLESYATSVVDRVTRIDRPLWLVGHSMGGVSITQAAESLNGKLRGLVYLAAFLPTNGQSLMQLAMMDGESHLNKVMIRDQENGTVSVPEEQIRECFYGQCSETAYRKALARISRDQAGMPAVTPVSLSGKSDNIPKRYIECLQDKAISITAQRRMHRNAGVSGVTTLDSDHSPFLSCPSKLARVLEEIIR